MYYTCAKSCQGPNAADAHVAQSLASNQTVQDAVQVRIGLPHMVEVPGEKVELELEISVFIDPGQESVQWMRRPERVLSAGVSVLPSRSPE